jgi:hypothetical protein
MTDTDLHGKQKTDNKNRKELATKAQKHKNTQNREEV